MAADAWTTRDSGAVFDLEAVLREHEGRGAPYHQFLKVPGLRMGIYKLAAGADDPQSPHDEDEVYYVLEGRSRFRVNDDVFDMNPGAIIYVEAKAPHKFFDVAEDLTLLVFFASDKRANLA